MTRIEELKEKRGKIEKGLTNPNIAENVKTGIKSAIAKIDAEIKSLEDEEKGASGHKAEKKAEPSNSELDDLLIKKEKLEKGIKNPNIPANAKAGMKAGLEKLNAQIAELSDGKPAKESKPEKEKKAPKAKAEKKAKPAKKEKAEKAKKEPKQKATKKPAPVKKNPDAVPPCDELEADYVQRRKRAIANAAKPKVKKPVLKKMAESMTKTITEAMKYNYQKDGEVDIPAFKKWIKKGIAWMEEGKTLLAGTFSDAEINRFEKNMMEMLLEIEKKQKAAKK